MTAWKAFAYAQVRIQSRWGGLPDEAAWGRVEPSGGLSHFLQTARATPLKPLLYGVGAESGIHDIELSLRRLFREQVSEVAEWHPEEWQGPLRWLAILPDLPLLEHLHPGEAPLDWMYHDPWLSGLLEEAPPLQPEALAASPFAGLAGGVRQGLGLVASWSDHWRDLRPATGDGLETVARAVTGWRRRLESEDSSAAADAELRRRLITLFRRQPQSPVAAVAYLARFMLELRRLRGALVGRALFAREVKGAA